MSRKAATTPKEDAQQLIRAELSGAVRSIKTARDDIKAGDRVDALDGIYYARRKLARAQQLIRATMPKAARA